MSYLKRYALLPLFMALSLGTSFAQSVDDQRVNGATGVNQIYDGARWNFDSDFYDNQAELDASIAAQALIDQAQELSISTKADSVATETSLLELLDKDLLLEARDTAIEAASELADTTQDAEIELLDVALEATVLDFTDDGVFVHTTTRGAVILGPFQADGLTDINFSASAIASGTASFSLVTTDPVAVDYPYVSSTSTELNTAITGAVMALEVADRLNTTLLEQTYEFDFVPGTDYWAVLFAGGGGNVTGLSINIGSGLVDVSTLTSRIGVLENAEPLYEPPVEAVLALIAPEYRPTTPIAIAANTVPTGLNLNTGDELAFLVVDDTTSEWQWPWGSIDLAELRRVGEAYVHVYDDDWFKVTVNDFDTGLITFTDSGRNVKIAAIQHKGYVSTGHGPKRTQYSEVGVDLDPAVTGAGTTDIVLDFDISTVETLRFLPRDIDSVANGGSWGYKDIDVVEFLAKGTAYIHRYDSGHLILTLVDATTGAIKLGWVNRSAHLVSVSGFVNEQSNFIPSPAGASKVLTTNSTNSGFEWVAPDLYTSAGTGLFRIGYDKPTTPIDIASTEMTLGYDLTQDTEMTIKFFFQDTTEDRVWQAADIDVDSMLEQYAAGNTLDAYVATFSTGYIRIEVVDPTIGKLLFIDANRNMEYVRSELWARKSETDALFEVTNSVLTVSTSSQNLGDANTLITGEDGSVVTIEWGSGDRQEYIFLGGIAKGERDGYGLTAGVEFIVGAGGQLQVTGEGTNSGISKVWYQLPVKAVGTTPTIPEVGGKFLGVVEDYNDLPTTNLVENDWAYTQNTILSSGAVSITLAAGMWYWNGSIWTILKAD